MPNRIYNKVPVEVPNRSGFFEGHYNRFSSKTGTLTPVLTDLLIPNDKVNIAVSCQVQLPPMASEFMGHIDMKFEAFFVPLRLCWGGFQDMITHQSQQGYPTGEYDILKPRTLPKMVIPVGSAGPGTLYDYLGGKVEEPVANGVTVNNVLPFVAYHLIYDNWYRNAFIQLPLFLRPYEGTTTVPVQDFAKYAKYLPYTQSADVNNMLTSVVLSSSSTAGGTLYDLRQRNWPKDYFTNAKPSPQFGTESSLGFKVDTDTGNGSFTIASLRAANSMQQWADRQNLCGPRYWDQIKGNFGIRPSDAVVDRPIYIGQQTVPVYTKGVSQTGAIDNNRQPFNTVGTQYGQSVGVGNGNLGSFHATEYGYIMVIASLVPRVSYSTGTRRHLMYSNKSHFANPLLQGVGDQAIYTYELSNQVTGLNVDGVGTTFAYTQRFAEYKDMQDEVHGLLRDGQSLDMFALQRSFGSTVSLGTDFIQIPTNYLDQVTAVESATSNYGYWCDCWFNYNKTSVLQAYSLPTLGDLKNTHTDVIPNGGTML